MWRRFTVRARRSVFFAQEESQRFGEKHCSTEHLLLGILRQEDCRAVNILHRVGISLGHIRSEIEAQTPRGDRLFGQDLALTPSAKSAINLAVEEADSLNTGYVGTEHLLLGLLRESDGLAGRVLLKAGAKLGIVRDEVKKSQCDDTDATGQPNPS